MINRIEFIQYRKLKNIAIDFVEGINAIAGTNGTCKSTLLHLFSNSFQRVNSKSSLIADQSCLGVLSSLKPSINAKIETLARNNKHIAPSVNSKSGTLYKVYYLNGSSVEFRKHYSDKSVRYSLKPTYKSGGNESLPSMPVIYLGISRLLPIGELSDDTSIKKLRKWLPEKYQQELSSLIKSFTNYELSFDSPTMAEDLKNHLEFSTNKEDIDSNTISAGEDNVCVILNALVCLHYYYDCLTSKSGCVESALLIDELDSTLHPRFQRLLIETLEIYSRKYKIQIVFTTQSYYLLELVLKKRLHLIYLVDNYSSVAILPDPDWARVKMQLEGTQASDVFCNAKIPVLTEDGEAEWMLELILDFYSNKVAGFSWIKNHLHLINAKAGGEILQNLFSDEILNSKTIGWICVLDGDHSTDLSKSIVALPGKDSPESVLFKYAMSLADKDIEPFWMSEPCLNEGFSVMYFLNEIKPDFDKIEEEICNIHARGESAEGVKRRMNKSLFLKYKDFFRVLFYHWLTNPCNESMITSFYENLGLLYKKTCSCAGLPSSRWPAYINDNAEAES